MAGALCNSRQSGVRRGSRRWTPFVISVCCAPCAPHTRIQCLRRERTLVASVSSCSPPSVRAAVLDSTIRTPLATRPPGHQFTPPMSRLRGSHEACWAPGLLSQGHSPLIVGGPSAHRPTVHDRSAATVVPAFLVPSTHCPHLLSVPPPRSGPKPGLLSFDPHHPLPAHHHSLSPTRPATLSISRIHSARLCCRRRRCHSHHRPSLLALTLNPQDDQAPRPALCCRITWL